jgi:hypothetical protein
MRQSVIRMAMARIKSVEIEKGSDLDDSDVAGVLAKEVKQHRESIAEFGKANRQDLIANEKAELVILLEYLPKQMSREEIVAVVRQAIEDVGAQGLMDKGKVMSKVMPQLKGKADGRTVNEAVTEVLKGE